jgi:trans-aconitate 2-methyltransferase
VALVYARSEAISGNNRQVPVQRCQGGGENADRYFTDTGAMVKWVDQPSLVPFLYRVDQPAKEEFRDFVVERMIDETLQPDGTCFETFRRINAFARK